MAKANSFDDWRPGSVGERRRPSAEMLELMIGEPLPVGGAGPEPLPPDARDEDEPGVAVGNGIVALERAHRPRAALIEDVPLGAARIAERTLVHHGYDAENAAETPRLIIVDECRRPLRGRPHPAGLDVKLR